MTATAIPSRMTVAAKEAALAAFVALALAIPMVGLHTVDKGGTLVVETRFDWVVIAVLAVFAGRLALALWPASLRLKASRDAAHVVADGHFSILKFLGVAAISLAVLLPVLPVTDRYVIDVATTVLIYVMLGWGLNIVVGLAGLLDLGYVAFYAVGA